MPAPHSPAGCSAGLTAPQCDFLDFCAIRLAGAAGRERGWYDLADAGALDNHNDLLPGDASGLRAPAGYLGAATNWA